MQVDNKSYQSYVDALLLVLINVLYTHTPTHTHTHRATYVPIANNYLIDSTQFRVQLQLEKIRLWKGDCLVNQLFSG